MQINTNVKPTIKSWTSVLFLDMFWYDMFWPIFTPKDHLSACKSAWSQDQGKMSSNTGSQNPKMHKIISKYVFYDEKFRSIIAELSQGYYIIWLPG